MFERVVKYGMTPRYVIPLLALSQSDFLSTLTSGIERVYQRKITRTLAKCQNDTLRIVST